MKLTKKQAHYINSNKHKYGLRELATKCAEKFSDLNLCPGNQAEGVDLITSAEKILKKK